MEFKTIHQIEVTTKERLILLEELDSLVIKLGQTGKSIDEEYPLLHWLREKLR